MCGSMADIQSPTAEIRRGKKKRKKEQTTDWKYIWSALLHRATIKSRHLGTIPQLCRAISSQLRHVLTIGKNLLSSNISSTCPHNMVNSRPTSGWDPLTSLGHPYIFQRVSRLGSVTARHSSIGRQPNCGVEQRAPPIFSRAAIMLGIGPHSSCLWIWDIWSVDWK